MPSNISIWVTKLSQILDKPINEVEKCWEKAKKITSETFNRIEESFTSKEYNYTAEIVKKMLGVDENLTPDRFLKSGKTAKEFLEEITSSDSFGINNTLIPPEDKDIIVQPEEKEIASNVEVSNVVKEPAQIVDQSPKMDVGIASLNSEDDEETIRKNMEEYDKFFQ